MAAAGDVIEHPITRERITFLETAAATGAALVRFELVVVPDGVLNVPHVHPRQVETFEVRSGALHLVLGGKERRLESGEGAVVPADTPHAWRPTGVNEVVIVAEFRPAARTEEFLESLFGLAQDGEVDPTTGAPLQPWSALLIQHYQAEFGHASEPPPTARIAELTALVEQAARDGHRLPYPYPHTRRGRAAWSPG